MPRTLALAAALSLPLLLSLPVDAQKPWIAAETTADGTTWLIDAGGRIAFRSPGSDKTERLSTAGVPAPVDFALDASGNLVVAFDGDSGANIAVLDPAGSYVHRGVSDDGEYAGSARRVAVGPEGQIHLLVQRMDVGLQVRVFGSDYVERAAFEVGGSCDQSAFDWGLADLEVDAEGAVWVADVMACGTSYRVVKYSPDGRRLFELVGENGFSRQETSGSGNSNVMAVSDIFPSEESIFVVHGLTTPTGILVDVWSLNGEHLDQLELDGIRGPDVRGDSHSGVLQITELADPYRTHRVPFADDHLSNTVAPRR